MKFAIYQIRLTDAEIDLINEKGHDAVAKQSLKIKMDMDFSGDKIASLASIAMDEGYYTHVANIEANDYNQVFEIGNIGPEQNIERLARMHSISVGDVIISQEGQLVVVAPVGFVAFGFRPKMAA